MNQLYRVLSITGILGLVVLLNFPSDSYARACSPDFLDGLFKSQMKEHSVAGLTFSLYSADTLALTRSWGYSHVEEGRLADENTGFMIGSVSKLFVWVAVMQLVEQGKLSLDKPVNEYLRGFKLPDSYKPVTMKHLMVHTPGFEDRYHIFSKGYDQLPELETWLIENLPRQIYEPGTTPAYSNYGVALAAYVIEQITGTNFNDYVDKNVFEPLQMHNTTFRQPASFAISEAKSKGYVHRDGRFLSPFQEFVLPAPAGSAVSTSADMIKFMAAMLQSPLHDGDNILKDETITKMLSLFYAPHELADGMGYGFMRMKYFDKEIFWHGGDTYFFHTAFLLVPTMRTGVFFSINTANTGFNYVQNALLIVDYLNGNKRELNAPRRVNGMNHYAGTYKSTRRNESSYHKLFTPFMFSKVKAVPEGLMWQSWEKEEIYKPYDDDVFVAGHRKLVFERDAKGKISRLLVSDMPISVFEKISLRENPTLNIILLLLVLFIGLRNIVIPVWRLLKGDKRSRQLYRWLLMLSTILVYTFFILFFTTFTGVENVIFEKPAGLRMIMVVPLTSLIMFLLALVFWIQAGVWRRQPISATFWQFAGFLVWVVFYLQMNYWNLFNFLV